MEPYGEDEVQPKPRRPKTGLIWQQKLRAWQPAFDAKSTFTLFLVLGMVFIPIGIVLFISTKQIVEVTIDYTDCASNSSLNFCKDEVREPSFFSSFERCPCIVEFTLKYPIKGQVYLYYALTNFYQNHRRYRKSRDDHQLLGASMTAGSLTEDCQPLSRPYENGSAPDSFYAPCGLIANSLFNDTFDLVYMGNSSSSTSRFSVPLDKKGIAWNSDVNRKYGTPNAQTWAKSVKPPNWPISALERDPKAYKDDEELQVWMRPAALPHFRKLHRRIDHANGPVVFKYGLPEGRYQLLVNYSYPVTAFGGTKSIVFSTANWLGGYNPVLGITYIAVGLFQLLLAALMFFLHKMSERRWIVLEDDPLLRHANVRSMYEAAQPL